MNRTRLLSAASILVGWMIVCSPGLAQEDPLILEVNKGFHQSLESIKTIRAKFVCQHSMLLTSSVLPVEQGDYLRSGQTERVRQVDADGTKRDRLVQSGIVKDLFIPPKVDEHHRNSASINPFQKSYARSSAFVEFMIHHHSKNGEICHFNDLLKIHQSTLTAKRTKYQGKDCIQLTYQNKRSSKFTDEIQLWHDIEAGYWIVHSEVHTGSRLTGEGTIEEYHTVGPNLKFPSKVKWTAYNDQDQPSYQRIFELQNLVINGPIAKDELSLPLPPPGTLLSDSIQFKQGLMNSSWQLIGKIEPMQSLVAPERSIASTEDDSEILTPTQGEPLESGNFILYVSLGCGLLFGSILLVLRRRVRTASPT
ncbi:hypothetical protein [Tuwongella immobilis]|uniref:Uncharacterized protein n=1 Tax=Tuwongella immobilis TaxID=692036 RepID=A0A6C2YWC6_9BACT|nr:hypothetical protein [Tuwongella immobilis]VIP05165.1 unnamed protein product [Tuwongella immobilis]VTS07686.1 unnamed protein product [Tuwongella immobilis]